MGCYWIIQHCRNCGLIIEYSGEAAPLRLAYMIDLIDGGHDLDPVVLSLN